MIDFKRKPGTALLSASVATLLSLPGSHAADPNCIDKLKKDRARILEQYGKLQNYKTFTPQKARALQDKIEKYLIGIGDVLKNFNVDVFLDEELKKIPRVATLTKDETAKLEEILGPSFKTRRMPSARNLEADLKSAGLGFLPTRKIHETMDRSFRLWRTKLIFDESGPNTWNKLAKAYAEKQSLGEFSMNVGLLGKNEWEAFFEAEKGKGIFNSDVPGMLGDVMTSTSDHETVHMVVETLASRGHDSPYSFWMKIDKKYKKSGAIGPRQKKALAEAVDPLSDGDYYRNELYLDEIPAHGIQSEFLNVEASKALLAKYAEVAESARNNSVRDELGDLYADYLREGKIDGEKYSDLAKRKFETFLATPAKDERTHLSKVLTEMTEYANWIDLINNSGMTAAYEARRIIDEEVAAAKKLGQDALHPKAGGRIAIKPDVFLGVTGYRIEVRIPIDVLRRDGSFVRTPDAATVNFRFSGEVTKSITSEKLDKLFKRTDWIKEFTEENRAALDDYAKFLDETGALNDYTYADVFAIKKLHTRLRQIARKTLERIRAS